MLTYKLNLFVKEVVLFVSTQLLGIFIALKLSKYFTNATGQQPPQTLPDFSLVDFIVLAVVVSLFIFFTKHKGKAGRIFYRVFLGLIIFSGINLTVSAVAGPASGIAIAAILVFLFWYRNNIIIQNLSMVLTLAGVGAFFGFSIKPTAAIFILAIFSVYDIIAVYRTKHMVKLAKTMIESNAIFGFVVPSTIKLAKKKVQDVRPGSSFMILGSGDVAMPLILSSSVAIESLAHAWIVFTFSIAGLFITHIIFSNQKVKKPMAALPPIATASIIGYLSSILFLG